MEGTWLITTDGNYRDHTEKLDLLPEVTCTIHFVIKDYGNYDLDSTAGAIEDPTIKSSPPLVGTIQNSGSGENPFPPLLYKTIAARHFANAGRDSDLGGWFFSHSSYETNKIYPGKIGKA